MSSPNLVRPSVEIAASLSHKVSLCEIACIGVEGKILKPIGTVPLSYNVNDFVVQWHLDGKVFRVVLPFSIDVFNGDVERGDVLASFSVLVRADYVLNDQSLGVDVLPHYAGIMGYMHAWPYFRADVQYLSTKVGLPALVLPVVVSGQVPQRILVSVEPLVIPDEEVQPVSLKIDSPTPRRKASKRRTKTS